MRKLTLNTIKTQILHILKFVKSTGYISHEKNTLDTLDISYDQLRNTCISIKEFHRKSYASILYNPWITLTSEQCGSQLSAAVMRDGLLLVCRITGLKNIHKGQ